MKTNADAFREKVAKMSNEELVILLTYGFECNVCPCKKDCEKDSCKNLLGNWLKEPENIVRFKDIKHGEKFKSKTSGAKYVKIDHMITVTDNDYYLDYNALDIESGYFSKFGDNSEVERIND